MSFLPLSFLNMHPRLYMHSLQSAIVDRNRSNITFETRHANGCHYYFDMTRHQFFALDDIFLYIDKHHAEGHFPLGHNMWFHFDDCEAKLYTTNPDDRPYFKFQSFAQYKRFTHQRILSLLRSRDDNVRTKNGSKSAATTRGSRQHYTSGDKRPLSTIVQPFTQSGTPKRHHQSSETTSRASNNVVMPDSNKKSAILPEWNNTTARRRSDSPSSLSSVSEDLLYPQEEQSLPYVATDSMESE